MKLLSGAILGAITLAYPLLVYLGLTAFEPRILAALMIVVISGRLLFFKKQESIYTRSFFFAGFVIAFLIGAYSAIQNSEIGLRIYPVIVNATMLFIFAFSLLKPPSFIEQIARIKHPDLPSTGVRYTRNVTVVWCVFFLVNGAIALWTALYADRSLWALYNGLISYVLMGTLFSIEWLIRQKVMKPNGTAQ